MIVVIVAIIIPIVISIIIISIIVIVIVVVVTVIMIVVIVVIPVKLPDFSSVCVDFKLILYPIRKYFYFVFRSVIIMQVIQST